MDGKISNFMQIAGIRRYELTEGQERGFRVLDCDNGRLRFLLGESKALDVMQMYCEGKNLSFVSKNGFTLRDVPFARRFEGGMLYTCGLDAVGDVAGREMHGSHHNTPAKITRAECTEKGILIEAEMSETALFGQNLLFRRRIESGIGDSEIKIADTLENRGFTDARYCLLYHVNVGYPLFDEGAQIVFDAASVTPRNDRAEQNMEDVSIIRAPEPGREETCYFLRMNAPRVSLVNRKLGKAFTLGWSGDTLPRFVLWKSMASGDYALGFEPATCELDGGFAYRTLPAGQSVCFSLTLGAEDA